MISYENIKSSLQDSDLSAGYGSRGLSELISFVLIVGTVKRLSEGA